MAILQIANDLVVATVEMLDPPSGFFIGVECSQPISMQAATITRVSGVVQSIAGATFKLRAAIDGSNDLSTWVPVFITVDLIGSNLAPFKFAFAPASATLFPFAYARVRWILQPASGALAAGQRVVLSANLATGLR